MKKIVLPAVMMLTASPVLAASHAGMSVNTSWLNTGHMLWHYQETLQGLLTLDWMMIHLVVSICAATGTLSGFLFGTVWMAVVTTIMLTGLLLTTITVVLMWFWRHLDTTNRSTALAA